MKTWCPYCKKNCRVYFNLRKETYVVDGESITLDVLFAVCKKCGTDVWDDHTLPLSYYLYDKTHPKIIGK